MTRRLCIWPAILLSACLSAGARAYNDDGHIQIADIAWTRLTPHARAEVRRILERGDPMYRPASRRDADVRDAFRRAATFSDDIKRDLARHAIYAPIVASWTYRFYPRHAKPGAPDTEAPLCRSWHFYDTPLFVPAGKAPPPPRASNALVALPYAERQLRLLHRARRDPATQAWWLYWIEHLVGDLHQPLHCATSYARLADGDAGGNRFPLAGAARNLHAYWDEGIDHAWDADGIAGSAPAGRAIAATARWKRETALQPARAAVRDGDPTHWVEEGARLAHDVVYRGIRPHGVPGAAYRAAHVALCKRLAILAGYRLAAFLNRAL